MKYLITGGAGFLGINLIRYLLKKEKDCEITSLDLEAFTYPEKNKIISIVGDIREENDMEKALSSNPDFVIHCAAALPLYTEEQIFSTEVEGTELVLKKAFEHKVKRVVYISSTSVYGVPEHHPLYETDKLIGVGPYGKAKIAAEEGCLRYRDKGYCVPIIRPKSFIGEERLGAFAIFYEWAKDGKNFPMIGSGENRYQFLDVEDLCQAIYLLITKDKEICNDTFNIAAKEFATMREDYQAVLDCAGYGKKIKPFPAGLAVLGLSILAKLHLSPLYPWVYATAGKESFVSIEKAENSLAYKPEFSNKEALIKNYKWYLLHYKEYEGKSGVTHRVPWKQGALKIVKLFYG